jgi:hypothetical protein
MAQRNDIYRRLSDTKRPHKFHGGDDVLGLGHQVHGLESDNQTQLGARKIVPPVSVVWAWHRLH